MKITVSQKVLVEQKAAFKNGFFVDGFVFLESTDKAEPTLSLPFVSFNGDWSKAWLFDNTIYDDVFRILPRRG